MLELALGEGAAHIDNTLLPVDVSSLECDPFRRPQPGRRREQNHRPVPGPDGRGDGFEFRPRLERMLLLPASRRVATLSDATRACSGRDRSTAKNALRASVAIPLPQ